MLIDTHCHLDAPEFGDVADIVAAARDSGVAGIVVPAVEPANFESVRSLAHRFDGVAYALGIHPMFVERAGSDALESLAAALAEWSGDPKLVAIGEIGLDHFVPGLDRALQERMFRAQLAMAREAGLPVLMHVRRAQDRVLKHLRASGVGGGIAHAFNGSRQQAEAFIDCGCALGFGGAMTYARARRIRALAAGLPRAAIVLETDAPDIAPAWLEAGPNRPQELARIGATLADLRGESPAAVASWTGANALAVLPRLARALTRLPS
ncbi:MAG: TatD family hydrolase [Burkholderiaceae bacterium]